MDIKDFIQSGIIESYILGLATDEEITEVDRFKSNPEVQNAINDFSASLEQQAFANAIIPPPDVKRRIMLSLEEEFKKSSSALNVVVNNTKSKEQLTPPSKFKVWQFAAAASVILLLISAALNIYLFNRYSATSEQYQALLIQRNSLQAKSDVYQTHLRQWQSAAEMMADPAMAMIKMPGVEGKKDNMATVFWDTRSKDVFVMPNKLPAPSQNKQYQLWALVDGKPVDLGMLDPDCNSVCKMKNIPRAQAFAITLEKTGGSPSPTMDQMFVFGKA